MFRRAKLMLEAVDLDTLRAAQQPGAVLEARLRLTDKCGLPPLRRRPSPLIAWTAAET